MDICLSVCIQPSWQEICESWRQIDTQIRLYNVQQKIEFVMPPDAVQQYVNEVYQIKYSAVQQMEVWEQKTALLVMWLWRTDLRVSNTQTMVQQLLYHTVRMVIVSSRNLSVHELREGYFKILECLPEYMKKQFQQGWCQESVKQLKQVLDRYGEEVKSGEKFVSAKNMFALMVLDYHIPLDDLMIHALDFIQQGYLNIAIIATQIIRSGQHQKFFQTNCSQKLATDFQEALFEGHKLITPQVVTVHIGGRPHQILSSYLNCRYTAQDSLSIDKFRSKCALLDEYNNNLVVSGIPKISKRKSKIEVVDIQNKSRTTVAEVDQEILFLDTNGEQICGFGENKVWLYCGGRGNYQNMSSADLSVMNGIILANLTCGRMLDQKCFMSCWCRKDGQDCSRILVQNIADFGINYDSIDVFGDPVNEQLMIKSLAVSRSCPSILYTGAMYGFVTMWDLRNQDKVSLRFGSKKGAHTKGVESLDCWDNIVVSGSNDRSVRVWDVRQPQIPVAERVFDDTPVVAIKLLANLQSSSLKGIVGVCTTSNVYCTSLEQESSFKDESIQVLPLEKVDELVDFCWFASTTNIGLYVVSKKSSIYSFNAEYKI